MNTLQCAKSTHLELSISPTMAEKYKKSNSTLERNYATGILINKMLHLASQGETINVLDFLDQWSQELGPHWSAEAFGRAYAAIAATA